MSKTSTQPIQIPPLAEEEKAQLRLWTQATPTQRLAWLEEALKLAASAKARAEIDRKA